MQNGHISEALSRICTHAGVSADSPVCGPLTMPFSHHNRAGLVPIDHAKANREAIKQQSRANRERKVLALQQSLATCMAMQRWPASW